MTTRVNISDSILAWVMKTIQLDSLPKSVANNLTQWSKKQKVPTFNQIKEVSRVTNIPLGYFFLQSPPQECLSIVEYRTVDSLKLIIPSRNLVDTVHNMELVQNWVKEQLIIDGADQLLFVNSENRNKNSVEFAALIREVLNLSNDWFKHSTKPEDSFKKIREAMSASGVIVMTSGIVENNTRRTLDIEEFRGFAMADKFAPLIFINANDSKSGRLFSLLHEFAHICLEESSLFNDWQGIENTRRKTEALCNAVAAEILVPTTIFTKKWSAVFPTEKNSEKTVESLAEFFKCGTTVVARRALDFHFIDLPTYTTISNRAIELYRSRQKEQKHKRNGGNFYWTLKNRIDPRFLTMLASSVAEGKTLYTDAFRLTNTNHSTFVQLTAGGNTQWGMDSFESTQTRWLRHIYNSIHLILPPASGLRWKAI